jgi:hypothetical protein
MRIPIFTRPVTSKPYNRIPSDNFPSIDFIAEIVCAPIILLFCCIFMTAWNFSFPSPLERILWRVASTYMLVFGVVGGCFSGYCHLVLLPKRSRLNQVLPSSRETQRGRTKRLAAKLRNIDPSKDPKLAVSLRILIPLSTLCLLYALCRAYILVEDFIGLRRLPTGAFQTVSWSDYLPHW